jgi:DnaK suppressor protein
MDEQRARELLRLERERVERTLADAQAAQRMDGVDEQIVGDEADQAQRLTDEATDQAFVAGLSDRLTALDRAEQRLEEGTYGRSVLSGEPLPDERLEADPAAELTVEEAEEERRISDVPGDVGSL